MHIGVVSGSPQYCPCDKRSHANEKVRLRRTRALHSSPQSDEARADSEDGRNVGELRSRRAYKFTTGANGVRELVAPNYWREARLACGMQHAFECIRVTLRRRSFVASCLGSFVISIATVSAAISGTFHIIMLDLFSSPRSAVCVRYGGVCP